MNDERYGLIKDYTSFFKCKRGVTGIVDTCTNVKYIGFNEVCELLNSVNDELMDKRAENTKMKLVFGDVIGNLQEYASKKTPVIISQEYVDWIKENVDIEVFFLEDM